MIQEIDMATKKAPQYRGYVVFGGGKATKKVVWNGLDELKEAADEAGQTMWLTVVVDPEETAAHGHVFDWAQDNEVEFRIFVAKGSDVEIDDEIIEATDTGKLVTAADPLTSAIKDLVREGGEDAALVLFDEDDEALPELLDQCAGAGLRLLELSAGLEPIELDEAADEPEPEPAPRKGKKAAEPEPEEDDDEPKAPKGKAKKAEPEDDTPDYGSMRITSLRKLYREAGLGDPEGMEKDDLIAALSGAPAPEAADEPVAPAKGKATPGKPVATDGTVLMVALLKTGVHVQQVNGAALREFIDSQAG